MGWFTSLVLAESGTHYNMAKGYGQVILDTIET